MSLYSSELRVPGVTVLEIAGADAEGRPLVRESSGEEPRRARVVWMREEPAWERCSGLRVVVAREEDREDPIVLGLLDPPPEEASAASPRNLRVESREELVIQCGKARIALRADGRIEIRGGHLISRSSGPNKIKGASIHIN